MTISEDRDNNNGNKIYSKRIRWIVLYQVIGIVAFFFIWWGLSKMKAVPFISDIYFEKKRGEQWRWGKNVFPDNKPFAGDADLYALVSVTFVWSLFGGFARAEYYLGYVLWKCDYYWQKYSNKEKQESLLKGYELCVGSPAYYFSRAISKIYLGVAVANVIVLFMVYTNILGLSLEKARPGAVAAIAFVLGFYPQASVKALGGAMGYIVKTLENVSVPELEEEPFINPESENSGGKSNDSSTNTERKL